MHQNKSRVLIYNTKWIYISKIITQLLGVIATVLVINRLSVDIYGTYNILLNSFVVFQILAVSAVANVFDRYIPEMIANTEFNKFKKFVTTSLLFSGVFLSFLIILLYIEKDLFADFFNIKNFSKYFLIFVFYCYSSFFQILIDKVLKALLLHQKVGIITIFNSLIRTSLYIIFFNSLDVNLLLSIEILIAVLYIIQSIFIYLKYTINFKLTMKTKAVNPVTFKRIRKYGMLSLLNELGVGIVGKTSDYFIVAALSNPYNVGLYAFANNMYGMVFKLLPFKDFQTILRPLFIQKYANDYNVDEFRDVLSFISKILLLLFVFPVIYFFFFGQQIISIIFGEKYLAAYWVTMVMLSSNIFLGFFFPLGLFAQLKERMDVILYSKITIVFSLVAGIYGMKYLGIIGVAFASLIGDIIKNSIILFFLRDYKEIRFNFWDYRNYFFILISLLPFLLVSYLKFNIFILIIISLLFVCYLFCSIIIFNPFSDYDTVNLQKIADNSKALRKISEFIKRSDEKLSVIRKIIHF